VTGGDIDILQEDCQSMQQEMHKLQRKNDVAAFGTEAFFDCDKKVQPLGLLKSNPGPRPKRWKQNKVGDCWVRVEYGVALCH